MSLLAVFFLSFLPGVAEASEVRITGFSFVEDTVQGPRTIEAREAVFLEGKRVILDQVSARMIARDGEELRVVGDKGRYDTVTLILQLEGHVVVHHGEGINLKAEKMTWDGSSATLRVREGVEMTGQTILVQGDSAVYNIEGKDLLFTGGVRTFLAPEGAEP